MIDSNTVYRYDTQYSEKASACLKYQIHYYQQALKQPEAPSPNIVYTLYKVQM